MLRGWACLEGCLCRAFSAYECAPADCSGVLNFVPSGEGHGLEDEPRLVLAFFEVPDGAMNF